MVSEHRTMPPNVVGSRVPPLPLEEVADHELHECREEHGDFTFYGVLSVAYSAPPPPRPPTSIVALLVPLVAPPVPPSATPLMPPIVLATPFQLNPDLGAFMA
ncbi:hypothetical protein GH714_020750 [Hevea brasiliensis]|uniref:Uncharacterized protein n=1 Tax=Hevea brasiliensis TaxID=3981 RepID=A0A6A6L798_HEVBR|nr:hypothetical protein GH714_020750 [Hevea brasiliensis]